MIFVSIKARFYLCKTNILNIIIFLFIPKLAEIPSAKDSSYLYKARRKIQKKSFDALILKEIKKFILTLATNLFLSADFKNVHAQKSNPKMLKIGFVPF